MLEVQKGCNGDVDINFVKDKFSYPHLSRPKGVRITEDAMYLYCILQGLYSNKQNHSVAFALAYQLYALAHTQQHVRDSVCIIMGWFFTSSRRFSTGTTREKPSWLAPAHHPTL